MKRSRLWKLKHLQSLLTFEHAGFDNLHGPQTVTIAERDVTDFIRTRTQLYLDTWVRPLLAELIEQEEQKARRRRKS